MLNLSSSRKSSLNKSVDFPLLNEILRIIFNEIHYLRSKTIRCVNLIAKHCNNEKKNETKRIPRTNKTIE